MDTLSILLLLDTSGSMDGEKIYALNSAVSKLISGFKDLTIKHEPEMAIITFGGSPKLHTPFTLVNEITFQDFEASGDSPLTEALILAKSIIKRKTTIILVSDGSPNDGGFARVLDDITLIDRVYSIGIGFDADIDMLERFTKNKENILPASDAENMAGYFLKNLTGNEL